MQINIGTPERAIRLILGIVLLAIAFFASLGAVWSWLLGLVGVVLIVTGVLRFCPAWKILGIDTRDKRK